jgi:hypothetical protein
MPVNLLPYLMAVCQDGFLGIWTIAPSGRFINAVLRCLCTLEIVWVNGFLGFLLTSATTALKAKNHQKCHFFCTKSYQSSHLFILEPNSSGRPGRRASSGMSCPSSRNFFKIDLTVETATALPNLVEHVLAME